MDHNQVREELCEPVDVLLVAIVVDKHILGDVQVVLATKDLPDFRLRRWVHRALRRLVVPVGPDVAAVDRFGRFAGEGAGKARNLVLGELWKIDEWENK